MYKINFNGKRASAAMLAIALLSCSFAYAKTTENAQNALEISLEPSQLLSLIAIDLKNSEESKTLRKEYFTNAVPMARKAGYTPLGSLRVTEQVVGKAGVQSFVIASWPSDLDDLKFEKTPELQQYKDMRPLIWNRLDFFKQSTLSKLLLTFSKDKFYTLAIAKVNPERPDDYQTYLKNIESYLHGINARYFYQMTAPRVSKFSERENSGYRVTLVEWQKEGDLERFQNSVALKDNYQLLRAGTTGFELFRVEPTIR